MFFEKIVKKYLGRGIDHLKASPPNHATQILLQTTNKTCNTTYMTGPALPTQARVKPLRINGGPSAIHSTKLDRLQLMVRLLRRALVQRRAGLSQVIPHTGGSSVVRSTSTHPLPTLPHRCPQISAMIEFLIWGAAERLVFCSLRG